MNLTVSVSLVTFLVWCIGFATRAFTQYLLSRAPRAKKLLPREGYCIVNRLGKQHYRKLPTKAEHQLEQLS